jgi:hypothetical protein
MQTPGESRWFSCRRNTMCIHFCPEQLSAMPAHGGETPSSHAPSQGTEGSALRISTETTGAPYGAPIHAGATAQ